MDPLILCICMIRNENGEIVLDEFIPNANDEDDNDDDVHVDLEVVSDPKASDNRVPVQPRASAAVPIEIEEKYANDHDMRDGIDI